MVNIFKKQLRYYFP